MNRDFPYVFVRECSILKEHETNVKSLKIYFGVPVEVGDNQFLTTVLLESEFFDKTISSYGVDGAQSFFGIQSMVLGFLKSKKREGYIIYWLKDGDIEFDDFWR
jgi:hypothetical protein